MILSKDSNNNWAPTTGDSRMFINAMGIQGIVHWTDRAASW